jgi:hypothetical protein
MRVCFRRRFFIGATMRIAVVVGLLLMPGASAANERTAQLKPYIGLTMADFTRKTQIEPSDSYDTSRGRMFLIEGPDTAVTVSPGVVVQGGCRIFVETVAIGTRSAADNWRITEITANNRC